MLTYNRPQLIGRAVESVVAQSFRDWELIVVQDGANEHTIRVMTEWAAADARIRYFRRDRGGNIADATNYGLDRAAGEYVAVLDDDDAWSDTEKLATQVEFLDREREYAACGGGAIVVNPEGAERFRYLKPETDEAIRRRALMANPMIHSTGMFRRELLRSLGNYDATLEGFQDWDVWLKLGERGKLYNFPRHFLYYTLWEGGGSFHSQRGNARSALRIVRRHRKRYSRFAPAWIAAALYYLYSLLPVGVKRATYTVLSQAKKRFFSGVRSG